jgi:phage shock protein PspC (stress-responsive transcriptional regulator)
MNKVISINLNGNVYQLEEEGYDALSAYLDTAQRQLAGNPDKDEIVADIEQSIADKFRTLLGPHKTVVVTKEVRDVIAEMGPVQDPSGQSSGAREAAGGDTGSTKAAAEGAQAYTPKRLYRIKDGAKVGGVCNGLAAYFDVDVTLVRIVFAFTCVLWGTGALLYLIMMWVVPVAETAAEKAAASGIPSTAEDFIRRAREGYYEGMKTFGDRKAYREWKRKFKEEMRASRRAFRWQMHWGTPSGAPASVHPGWWASWTLLRAVRAALLLLFLFALLSLTQHGPVFSALFPGGAPMWMAILFLFIVYKVVSSPFKGGCHGYEWGGLNPFAGLLCTLSWFAFLFLALWVAGHFVPGIRDFLEQFRHFAHHGIDALRDWWAKP